jgi:hypothetical protein
VIEEQNLSQNDISRVLEQAETILRRIQSVTVHGYWRLNHNHQWNNYVRSTINGRIKEKQYLFDISFTEEDLNICIF